MKISVIDVSPEAQHESGTLVIRRDKKRRVDHGFYESYDEEFPVQRNPKRSKKRKIVQNGEAPLSASNGDYELPQDEQLLEEVAAFLSRCSKKKARLSSIGSYLDDIGFHFEGALCPTLVQNRHLFKVGKNQQGKYIISLKQKRAPRQPPSDFAGADYDVP
jgi:hypothetical protein